MPNRIDQAGRLVTGWLVSCLLHGSLAVAAILFVQRMQLAPQAEPFKWNVTMAAPSPITAPSAPETSVPTDRVKTAPAPALQQPTPLTTTARFRYEPSHPRVETPAVPPLPPVAPVVGEPAPPPIAELTSKPPVPSKPEPVVKPSDTAEMPAPPVTTAWQRAQTMPAGQSIDTPVGSPPRDPTPAAVGPHPQHSSTALAEPMPPAPVDSTATHSETQANQEPTTAPGPQVAALAPAGQPKLAKVDYRWLSDLMARWIEDLDKRYPAVLRTEGIQGKVTLTAMLHEDGALSDVRVVKSSGNATLDQVAVEDVERGGLIKLSRPLERPSMPVKFSIIYDLKTAP